MYYIVTYMCTDGTCLFLFALQPIPYCSPFLTNATAASLIHISFELHLYSKTSHPAITINNYYTPTFNLLFCVLVLNQLFL